MADIADIADSEFTPRLERRIAEIRATPPAATETGACLCCDEPLAPPQRWCDPDCRDLWEKKEKGGLKLGAAE